MKSRTLRELDKLLIRETRASLNRMARLVMGKDFGACGEIEKRAVLFLVNLGFAHQGVPMQITLDEK